MAFKLEFIISKRIYCECICVRFWARAGSAREKEKEIEENTKPVRKGIYFV